MTTIDLLQNILWTALVFLLPSGALLAVLFTTDPGEGKHDPWRIPIVLSFVVVSALTFGSIFLGSYLILYAIWN